MRLDIVAAVCTVTIFVVLGFLVFSDNRSAEWRAQTRLAAAKIATPSVADESSAVEETATPAPPPEDVPQPTAARVTQPVEIPRAALNQILNAAARGKWLRVDELLLGIPSASSGSSQDEPSREALRNARQAIDAEEYGTAIGILTALLDKNPNDAEALNLLGFAQLRVGKPAEAHVQVARSLAIEPHRAATWANAAEIFAERGNRPAAEAALRIGIHLSQDRERTLQFLSEPGQAVRSKPFRSVIANVLPDVHNIPSLRSPS